MSKRQGIVFGTLLLTGIGFLCKIIGFFFRLFLSQIVGAEGLGLYQLVFPVFGICFSLCCGSYQTVISRGIAAAAAMEDQPRGHSGKNFFFLGLLLSFSTSLLLCLLVYTQSEAIASHFLLEPRCAPLLRALAFSIPFASINSCICGYYIGKKKLVFSGFSQLVEQLVRVFFVLLMWLSCETTGHIVTPLTIVLGSLVGEAGATLFLLTTLFFSNLKRAPRKVPPELFPLHFRPFLHLLLPLIATHLILHLLSSVEALLVPSRLKAFGYTPSEALSLYGILSGMVLPFIIFPGAVTNSLAVVLLPHIAEAQAKGEQEKLSCLVTKTLTLVCTLGCFSTLFFLFFGEALGSMVFQEALAGTYLQVLAPLCPFLFLATTLSGILNGLGQTRTTFLHSVIVSGITIIILYLGIPKVGMQAYLFALLLERVFLTLLHHRAMLHSILLPPFWKVTLLRAACSSCLCILPCYLLLEYNEHRQIIPSLPALILLCILSIICFIPFALRGMHSLPPSCPNGRGLPDIHNN